MKKYVIIILVSLYATGVLAGGPFEKAMSKNIPAMFQASTPQALQSTINKLDRVGAAEETRWEPYYYAAFGYLRMSGMQKTIADKDKYLDLALESIAKSSKIDKDNSELETLRGYVHMIRTSIDPAMRGMKYSGMAFESFQKALALNPDNPRAHYLLGQMQYGTAKFMGGGDGGACESFATAQGLFAAEAETDLGIAPSWGRQSTEESIANLCKKGE